MRDKGRATAVATLLAAFATAHLMQFGLSAGRAISATDDAQPIGLATLVAVQGDGSRAAPAAEPVMVPDTPDTLASLPVHASRGLPDDAGTPGALASPRLNGFGLPCERTLALLPDEGASVRFRLSAPCDPGVRVEIRHAGLRFALETGADGQIDASLPAMAAEATVEALFADRTAVRAVIPVPEADDVERVALVAEGWAGLSLHPAEFGGLRGGGLARDQARAAGPRGGALDRLGLTEIAAPLIAEVYTLPFRRFGASGEVTLRVEAEVTPSNCGRDVTAELLRFRNGSVADRSHLGLAMPGCDAVGDVLVVELPWNEVRVARN